MRINVLLTSLLLLTLASCGSDSGSEAPAQGPTVVRQTIGGAPIFYPQEHLVCHNPTEYKIDILHDIYFHIDGLEATVDTQNLNRQFIGFPELKSSGQFQVVSGTQYKFQSISVTKKYVDDADEVVAIEQEESEVKGQSIKICDDQKVMRVSAEHIAVDIVETLSKSFQALAAVDDSKSMAQVEVHSHPSILEVEKTFDASTKVLKNETESLMTDNAFYYNGGIYFIPHSEEYISFIASRGYEHVNFWEIPFIASHEYGHMVFETFFPRGTKKLSFREQAQQMNCISGDWKKRHMPPQFNKGQRVLSHEDILGAFNEGFADMFAYYTLDSKMVSLKNVPWFEGEREVDSLFFGNGDRKVYNKYVADIFFSSTELGYRDAGSTFQDGHTIGAIFAANINDFMNKVGATTQKAKLKISINWLKSLENNHVQDSKLPTYTYMFKVLERYVDQIKQEIGVTKLSDEQKNLLSHSFPMYDFEIRQNL